MLSIISVIIFLIDIYLFFKIKETLKETKRINSKIEEMILLGEETLKVKNTLQLYYQKAYIKKEPPVVALENLFNRINVKDNLRTIKPLPTKTVGKNKIYTIEIKFYGLNLNKLIKILYEIEYSKEGFIIKKARIGKEFSSPHNLFLFAEVFALKKS